jgi:hypothetical protein
MTQYFSGYETTERESLKDTITVRAAYMTPLLRQLPQVQVRNRIEEWALDEPFKATENVRSMSAPHANTRREGSTFSYRTPFYPIRMKAIAEIAHFGMEMSNTDRTVVAAGMSSTFDYRAGQLFTLGMNHIDNALLYGQGSPATSGDTDERRTQGLIFNSAWTGLERCHGTKTSVEDPYGTTIPGSMFSVFFDANHTNISSSMFFNQIIARGLEAGADLDTQPWVFHTGYRAMQQIARFMIADGGVPVNERTESASSGMGFDYLTSIKLPSGHIVNFRTNRWLSERNQTFTVDNRDYTPGSPNTEGSINRVFAGDETIVGWEPGTVRVGWLREPAFINVATDGDFTRVAFVAEYMLQVDHPLCVMGAGNILA